MTSATQHVRLSGANPFNREAGTYASVRPPTGTQGAWPLAALLQASSVARWGTGRCRSCPLTSCRFALR